MTMPVRCDANALRILGGSAENAHLAHEAAVLRDCLQIAAAALAFDRSPACVTAMREIQRRLIAEGLRAVDPHQAPSVNSVNR
jgi:hypothetical protein